MHAYPFELFSLNVQVLNISSGIQLSFTEYKEFGIIILSYFDEVQIENMEEFNELPLGKMREKCLLEGLTFNKVSFFKNM